MNYQKSILLLLVCCYFFLTAKAQIKNPTASLKLTFQQESGTNASAVTYNPDKKLYYAIIAGNPVFPLETFDAKGKPLHQTNTGFDSRGMWYNPQTKQLEINGYYTNGLVGIPLDTKGFPESNNLKSISTGKSQPDVNSCGALNTQSGETMYYYSGGLYFYKKGVFVNNLPLGIPVGLDNINETSLIYTGKGGFEIGVLDYIGKKVFLFDIDTGKLTATIQLPSGTVTNAVFWFSYANNHVWLYNTSGRTWTGYKIFKK